MERKREVETSPGEPKRHKNEKENDGGADVPKLRTKYNFGPMNSLSTPLKSIKVDKGSNVNAIRRTPSKPAVVCRSELSMSSDDHIFWAPTPRQQPQLQNRLPSSPTDYTNIRISPVNPISGIHKNTEINFENLDNASPEVKRTTSTSFTDPQRRHTESTKRMLRSFPGFNTPLNRPELFRKDVKRLINTVESGMSSTPETTSLRANNSIDETPVPVPLKRSLKAEETLDDLSDFFSEDFSEDFMNDLDAVLARKSQSAPATILETASAPATILETAEQTVVKTVTKADAITRKMSQTKVETLLDKRNTNEDSDHENTMDALGDSDDDLFDDLLLKKTQTNVNTLTKVNHTPLRITQQSPTMTTQERVIRKVDKEGHLVFKKDIEDTDNMNHNAFKRDEVNLARTAVQRDGVHRFQVMHIVNTFYVMTGMKKPQKLLAVVDADSVEHKIFLRDMWQSLEIQPGDVIHIVGEQSRVVDSTSNNLFVWNPDLLLSATLVSDTISCQRRAVLKTRLDFPGDYNIPLIVGEIVHSIFQEVLKQHHCSMQMMQQVLDELLEEHILKILTINETKQTVRAEVVPHLSYIRTWFELYVKERPSGEASIKINRYKERTLFATSNIIDIEENIWSPIYGLRGLIDVTIEAYLRNMQTKGKFVAPLELKSGAKATIGHKSQAALYTLMMKDRYEMDVKFFMLVYTKLKETTKHEIDMRELKELMMLRNSLSQYMKEGTADLPGLVKRSQCDVCYAQEACMTINKLVENGTEEDSGLNPGVFSSLTNHLTSPKYSEFYEYWNGLVTKEEGTINLLKRDLFMIDSDTRERTSGKCLSNLIIESSEGDESDESDSYLYTFKRKTTEGYSSLNLSQLSKHDRVIVSDEAGHFALCSGFITLIRENVVIVSTNRRLRNNVLRAKGFNMTNNQTFQTVLRPLQDSQDYNHDITFRIDKDEMFHGMKLARYNILNLFLKDGDSKRRGLIVDNVTPQFNSEPLPYKLDEDHTFNPDQISAFDKVLSAQDYSLLLGMPGTGKTTVIAQLIRFLVQNNKTVLLTSYTHSAVDNILIKIKDDGIGVLRLGAASRVHQDVRKFSPHKREIKKGKDLQEVYLDPPVVATTCLGLGDWIFNRRKFDYCIVDESSQVSMPVCLGPLKFCDKFVLVGDHFQLPPLVQNPGAKAGLSKSLFKILSEEHPECVVDLTHQYRMCADIMLLSNTLIYDGRLKCGSESVAHQSLHIPDMAKLSDVFPETLETDKRWMDTVLDEKHKVLFLNHDDVGGCHESSYKENIENPKEAELVYQIVEAMLLCGVPEKSIGVMSFYRAQLRLFYRKFAARKGIEMLTADQFQGRDKDCVIISLVKSNDKNNIGSLLKEWRRVNVAITRARSKLIIIGSKRTLRNLNTLNAFMRVLDSRGWFYDLPPNADTFYAFEEPSEEASGVRAVVKKMKDAKVIQNRPLAREIAEEMGI